MTLLAYNYLLLASLTFYCLILVQPHPRFMYGECAAHMRMCTCIIHVVVGVVSALRMCRVHVSRAPLSGQAKPFELTAASSQKPTSP